jgi:hypothetical protein
MNDQKLQELESLIDSAQCQVYEALKEIRDDNLYPERYLDFWEYLKVRHGYSQSWYSVLRANYNALCEIDVVMPFKNDYAKRQWRTSEKAVRQAVYSRAVALAKSYGDSQVSAAHIKAVAESTESILRTGYADDGDGSMTAADGQIEYEYQEQLMRQKAYLSNGNQWHKFKYVVGTNLVIPGIEPGHEIEMMWREL